MAYFDSSKNRALWDIRLAALKKERAEREAGKSGSEVSREPVLQQATPGKRVLMTYKDLLKEEADAVKKPPRTGYQKKEKDLGEREKEARTYEKG